MGDTMFGVRHVKLDPRDPHIVYATAFNNAIHRSAPSLEGGDASFKPVYAIVGRGRFQDLAMFDLTVNEQTHADVRLQRHRSIGGAGAVPARQRRRRRPRRSSQRQRGARSRTPAPGSKLTLELDVAARARPAGASALAVLLRSRRRRAAKGSPTPSSSAASRSPTFGEPTIRSTNAGASFFGFGSDAQTPRNRSHVDVRAVVFHPRDPTIAFVGSDGGVVRNDGTFTNISSRCQQLFSNAPQCPTCSRACRRGSTS